MQKQAGEKKEETIERKISKAQKQTEQKKEEIVERKISRVQKQTEEKKEETIGRKISKVHIPTDGESTNVHKRAKMPCYCYFLFVCFVIVFLW